MESTEELEERTLEGCLAPSSLAMIAACFRHQHPEDFGRAMVDEGPIPPELRYGTDHVHPSGRIFPEESMGDPDALTA